MAERLLPRRHCVGTYTDVKGASTRSSPYSSIAGLVYFKVLFDPSGRLAFYGAVFVTRFFIVGGLRWQRANISTLETYLSTCGLRRSPHAAEGFVSPLLTLKHSFS